MKLNSGFISHNDGGEILLVSTGAAKFSGLVRSNSSAGFIIQCLEEDTTPDEISAKLCAKYEIDHETARHDVDKIISKLREIGAIDE